MFHCRLPTHSNLLRYFGMPKGRRSLGISNHTDICQRKNILCTALMLRMTKLLPKTFFVGRKCGLSADHWSFPKVTTILGASGKSLLVTHGHQSLPFKLCKHTENKIQSHWHHLLKNCKPQESMTDPSVSQLYFLALWIFISKKGRERQADMSCLPLF